MGVCPHKKRFLCEKLKMSFENFLKIYVTRKRRNRPKFFVSSKNISVFISQG